MQFKDLPPVKEQLMKCVRCGSCRSVCPVFAEIRNETVAPRGHVFMVQMLRDGNIEPTNDVNQRLTSCLMCESCTVNCPSGIDIHELNAAARAYITEKNSSSGKNLVFDKLWTNPPLLRSMIKCMWGVQKTGLQSMARKIGLMKILPGDLSKAEKIMSSVPFRSAKSQLKEYNPAVGEKKFTVAYFLGCGTDLLNPNIALASVNVLTNNGCDVIVPKNMKCCGLPQIANGKLGTAQTLLTHNVKVFNSIEADYVVTDCGSCSSALSLKNLEFMLHGLDIDEEARSFSSKVIDLTCFLVDILDIKLPEEKPHKMTVTYHDPCHLINAQKISAQPRRLLNRIPGMELVEMVDANKCCGGSGTYSLTHYDLSMKILAKKMKNIKNTGAKIVATCCPSCIMQLKHGSNINRMDLKILHPIEIINSYYE